MNNLPPRLTLCAWSLFLLCAAVPVAQAADEKPKLGIELPATDEGLPGEGPIRRYDWFTNLWKERRSIWAQRGDKDQGALVFLGDSITQGWGDDVGGSLPGVKVANRGISGDTTRGMLIRLQDDVLALHPKVPLVVCQTFPSSASMKRPTDKIKALNALYAAAVKGDPQVIVLDTWTLFANAEGDAKAEEFPDLLHPNEVGYKKWAAALRPILATLELVETEHDDFQPEPGFVSLFNGHDLTGWGFRIQKTLEKTENFDGKATSSDGRYVAKHGRIVVTTPAEGRRVQQMWTTQEFPKDFVLKLEFRATPNADSGVFIRQPQLQCRDYPLAGPYKMLTKYRAQDWNELVIDVKDNVAHCTCNGEVLEAEFKLPATGPIGLEGDAGQMEYRRIRLMEKQ